MQKDPESILASSNCSNMPPAVDTCVYLCRMYTPSFCMYVHGIRQQETWQRRGKQDPAPPDPALQSQPVCTPRELDGFTHL